MPASRRIGLLILLVALACPPVFAQSRFECGAIPSRILKTSVRYCAFLPPSYDATAPAKGAPPKEIRRYPVLYFLHGRGDNERSLLNTGGWNLIDDLREKHEIGEFLIVTPDAGDSFYVNSRDGRVRYSDFFLREFMPAIEHKYRIRAERTARGIGGISMGGYGALRFAFDDPQLFVSVSAQSAALVAGTRRDLESILKTGLPLGAVLGGVFGNPIDVAYWQENSPLFLARKNSREISKMKIYIDCGLEDDYGFDRGARELDRELSAEKIAHEFHLYPGGHNLPYFLEHLGAVMIFHSRAFEGR